MNAKELKMLAEHRRLFAVCSSPITLALFLFLGLILSNHDYIISIAFSITLGFIGYLLQSYFCWNRFGANWQYVKHYKVLDSTYYIVKDGARLTRVLCKDIFDMRDIESGQTFENQELIRWLENK